MKIIVTGPESSGKTHLSHLLSERLSLPLVEEFSRSYLNSLNRRYTPDDLVEMSRGQLQSEEAALQDSPVIICDTSVEVYKIWYEFRFGPCPVELEALVNINPADFYLLMRPNIPWEPDPLRENPEDRDELFESYKVLLASNKADYFEIDKLGDQRVEQALEAVHLRMK